MNLVKSGSLVRLYFY